MIERRGGCGAYPNVRTSCEYRGDARGVVGRAVADVVAGVDVAAGVTEMVVVGTDHDVLVGEVGAREAHRSHWYRP